MNNPPEEQPTLSFAIQNSAAFELSLELTEYTLCKGFCPENGVEHPRDWEKSSSSS